MNNAIPTSFGSQPSIEESKAAVLRAAKHHDDFMNNEEPEDVDYNSLEEALTGE